ncbi:MAG TPA: glycosyltransferase family 87 protein [Ilumatobacteraceae bacterium]
MPIEAPRSPLTARNIGLTALVAILLHAPALVRKAALNSDEATIATIARMVRHGASLYSTAVDRKPPGAFTMYRLLEPIFGGWTLTAGRWLALAATVTAMWIVAMEARRRWPGVDPLMVALLGVVAFSLLPAEDSRAVGFELLATLPAVGAFVLGARGKTLLAGVALGLAALFKQPMLLGALPLTVQCLTMVEPWARRVLRLLAAGAATVAVIVLGLAPFGFSDALHWYTGTGDNYLGGTHLSTVAVVILEQIGSFAGLTMGVLLLMAIAWGRKRLPLDVTVWVVASLIGTAIGLRFILHYFNQLLPSLVLVAAPALTGWTVFRTKLRRFALVWLAGGVAFSLWTLLDPNLFHDLPQVDHVVAAIDARTKPGDKIFVWGQAPEIYWTSDRDPATRYPHVGFITGITPKRPGVPAYVLASPGAAENLLADLTKNHPVLIIDAAIKSVRGGDRYPLATSPIAAYVAANYCKTDVVDGETFFVPCVPK